MLSGLGAKSTVPLTLNTFIHRPASTRPSQRHTSESRPNCSCAPSVGAPSAGAVSRTASAEKSLILFIIPPSGRVRASVDHNASAERVGGDPRSSVADREIHAPFPSLAARRDSHRDIGCHLSTDCFDAEPRAGAPWNV